MRPRTLALVRSWIDEIYLKVPMPLALAIRLFKGASAPAKYFTCQGERFVWPPARKSVRDPVFPPNLTVVVHGHTLGYVQYVQC